MSRKRTKYTVIPVSDVTITGLSHEGRGIASLDGKTTFVEGALPGEIVDIEIIHRHSRYQDARVTQIKQPSPERIEPGCPHFEICGGCALQHLGSDGQIRYKQAVLAEQLAHFGGLTPDTWLAPITGPQWGYRRKARLGVKYVEKKQRLLIGFREKRSSKIADLSTCKILDPSLGERLPLLTETITKLDSVRHIPQLEVAIGDQTRALIVRHLEPLSDNDQAQLKVLAEKLDYWLYLQPKGPDTIHRLWPSDDTEHESLTYDIKLNSPPTSSSASASSSPSDHYTVQIAFEPNDFTQVNATINQRMIQQALDLLALTPDDDVLDLFSGLGNFSLAMAHTAATVTAIEGAAELSERAAANATRNGLTNCTFLTQNLFEPPFGDSAWAKRSYNKILLDPPRTGAADLVEFLPHLDAEKIVYVSCNPATLARDAGKLCESGYHLVKCGVLDMFPHTNHVESMALFERARKSVS